MKHQQNFIIIIIIIKTMGGSFWERGCGGGKGRDNIAFQQMFKHIREHAGQWVGNRA